MESFDVLLKGSSAAHGHLCPGQVIGVRMAMLGCELVGLENPSSPEQIKKLLVYVEIDRCATDAIAYVTGVKLGRRSLKFKDYGIMAATFLNLETRRAFRIVSTEESRDLACIYAPSSPDKHTQQLEAYIKMPLDVLFNVQEVEVDLRDWDLPGPSRRKTVCSRCGQVVRDGKEIRKDGMVLCAPCTEESYFKVIRDRALSAASE